ncbi:MAG: hypothetical protein JO345_21720 [Streptosporangiaceae bacterium]|nr:hypothetical protein [Streptosporangiaceae bacterium]
MPRSYEGLPGGLPILTGTGSCPSRLVESGVFCLAGREGRVPLGKVICH